MEFASKLRWIVFISIAAVFLILIGWGLFSIAQSIFTPNTDNNNVVTEELNIEVINTAQTAVFRVEGPVVANEEHRSYEISVAENVVSMKVFQGYQDKVIAEKSYQNTTEAYDVFLSALTILDVNQREKGTDREDDKNDDGFCPSGRRFIVELDSDLRRWSTSCSSKQGTAGFNMISVRNLFQKQVPDFRDLVRGTGL